MTGGGTQMLLGYLGGMVGVLWVEMMSLLVGCCDRAGGLISWGSGEDWGRGCGRTSE